MSLDARFGINDTVFEICKKMYTNQKLFNIAYTNLHEYSIKLMTLNLGQSRFFDDHKISY
jgi:hypothetical protein